MLTSIFSLISWCLDGDYYLIIITQLRNWLDYLLCENSRVKLSNLLISLCSRLDLTSGRATLSDSDCLKIVVSRLSLAYRCHFILVLGESLLYSSVGWAFSNLFKTCVTMDVGAIARSVMRLSSHRSSPILMLIDH